MARRVKKWGKNIKGEERRGRAESGSSLLSLINFLLPKTREGGGRRGKRRGELREEGNEEGF